MQLPWHERAIVEPEKIRDYLLSRAHPVGRIKAAFFESLGFPRATAASTRSVLG